MSVETEPPATPAPASASAPAHEAFVAFARDHSGLLFTGGYILLIVIGLMYNVWLFLNFRVNILYYAEASDFLLVPFREPLVSIVSIAPLPLWIWYMRGAQWLEKKIYTQAYRERMAKKYGALGAKIKKYVSIFAVVAWSLAFTGNYANYVARRIRDGHRKPVRVEMLSGGALDGPIIGTTSRFLFVWDAKASRARAVPVENVGQIAFRERKPKAKR